MSVSFIIRQLALPAAALCLLAAAQPAQALLDFFKKADKKVPTADERRVQEAAAGELLAQARAEQSKGNSGRASDLYLSILKNYPFSQAAAEAAYARALILRESGKLQNAFEALQVLIKD